MSDTKFTPGPWRVGNPSDAVVADTDFETGWVDEYRAYYGGRLICESVSPSDRQLIIAAPDLYAALATLLEANTDLQYHGAVADTDGEHCDDCKAVRAARAALAKARGES